MPEYLAPGVYVEEVSSGNKPIPGVSTSTAGFVGGAERGPLAPQFISSWLEFQRWYGGYVPDHSYLAYAVEGFFTNGGQRCFVARVVGAGADYARATLASDGGSALAALAIGPGTWGNRVELTVSKASRAEAAQPEDETAQWVKVLIELKDAEDKTKVVESELFDNLTHENGKSNSIINTVNAASHLVRLFWEDDTKPARLKDVAANPFINGVAGAALADSHFDGSDQMISSEGFAAFPEGLLGRGSGLVGLSMIDEISLLVAPDEVNLPQVTSKIIAQCETRKDRFAIVSAKANQTGIINLRPPQDSSYGAFYYPWIKVFDPSINYTRVIPSSGHVAGIYARTDIERGVHKAPANEVVRGAVDLEIQVTKAMQDMLNPRGVNCFRDFRSDGRGIRLWGARTMSSDPEWRYVNVRRLFLFVEESIEEGTQWVIFEPNDDATWAKVRRNITNFLTGVWRSGALMGLTPDEAFFVACDRTTMTQDDIDNGRLICVIGIAPVKPAEFVIFRISQKTADAAT